MLSVISISTIRRKGIRGEKRLSQFQAQIVLTVILLAGSVVFVLLAQEELAIALVGAVAGQGAAVGVHTAANGNGRR